MEGRVKKADLGRGQLAPIESELRANIEVWRRNLETIGAGIQERRPSAVIPSAKPDPALESWHALIYRMIAEMDRARNDLHVVAEDLVAAKADAEYRAVLVSAWPVNHFHERLSYLGAAPIRWRRSRFRIRCGLPRPRVSIRTRSVSVDRGALPADLLSPESLEVGSFPVVLLCRGVPRPGEVPSIRVPTQETVAIGTTSSGALMPDKQDKTARVPSPRLEKVAGYSSRKSAVTSRTRPS